MSKPVFKGFRHGVRELTVGKAETLIDFVSHELSRLAAPEMTALELIELGSVYVEGARVLNPAHRLKSGDHLRMHARPRRFSCPQDLLDRVRQESEDAIVVEKPAGLPIEPTVDNFKENLLNYLAELRGDALYAVHHLEDESSGLVVLAKSLSSLAKLKEAFAGGSITRVYVAFTEAPVPIGPLASAASVNILSCLELRATTEVISAGRRSWKSSSGTFKLVYRLEIEATGARPQMVREVLAAKGAPVIGDKTNGSRHEIVDTETGKSGPALHVAMIMI